MDSNIHLVAMMSMMLILVCSSRHSFAQDGGCSPSPPVSLVSSGTSSGLRSNNVPFIANTGPENILRPLIGGYGTDSWAVFSATQVQQHGLWCQVKPEDNNGLTNNIGDWYYPTHGGFTLLINTINDSTPYQSLKCADQLGLVVDDDVANYQGIVKCNTTVPNLNRDTNYIAVYADSVFNNYTGPAVEPNMTVSLLSSRDSGPNINIALAFNVSYGPPSHIKCIYGNNLVLYDVRNNDDNSQILREVIRSQYVSTSQPDKTRVLIKVTQPLEERIYTCTVTVEGRKNIINGTYNYDPKGSGTSTTAITIAGTPIAVTARRNGYTSVLVSWTAPSPEPAGYEVFYQTTAGISSRVSGGNTSSTELTLTDLTLGETYLIFVVAFGAAGEPVLPSLQGHTNIMLSKQPQLNDMLSLTSISSFIVVLWSPLELAPNNYNISISCWLFCDPQLYLLSFISVSGTVTTHTITGISAGSNCNVNVTALFSTGYSSNTITSSINTTLAAPAGAPAGLTSTSVGSRSLSVVWGIVACLEQRGPITGYRLRYSNGTSIMNTTGQERRHHNLTGLTPYTSYSVQVAAVNNKGTGPYSDPILTVETLQDVPGPVSELLATPGVAQLSISWKPPSESNGVIILYEVCFSSSGVFRYTNISTTQHTLTDLPPNIVVSFSVRAYTNIGPGEDVTGQACVVPSSSSTLPVFVMALLVLGWAFFIITIIGCVIITIIFMRVATRQRSKNWSQPIATGAITSDVGHNDIDLTRVQQQQPRTIAEYDEISFAHM